MQRLSLVVEDLTLLVVERERADLDEVALGPPLRGRCAHAFRAKAAVLRQKDVEAQTDSMPEAQSAAGELARSIEDLHLETGEDLFAASAIVTALRQVLVALGPSAATGPDTA